MPNLSITLLLIALFLSTDLQAQLPTGTTDTTAAQSSSPDLDLWTEANKAAGKHDFVTAQRLFAKLAETNPNDPYLLFNLGLTEQNLDHNAAAEAAYRKAIAADSKFPDAHLALGLQLARAGKVAEAHTELLAAATIPPEGSSDDQSVNPRALRALAKLDLASNAADARDELLAALKISPETRDDILLSAQIAESLNDLPLAETAYNRLLTSSPGDPTTVADLAHVLRSENKLAEAEALLTKALEAHPGDTALTAQLSSAYLADQDPAKSALAVPLVEDLHQKHPEEVSITRLLARLYAQTKQPAKADPLYTGLLAKIPNDPTLLDDYGANLVRLGRFAEAETVLKRAVADPQGFPTPEDLAAAYSDLAFSASENNDPTMTLQALHQRATVAPITAGSVFLEATAHDKLHQYKRASELYRKFLVMANEKFADQEWEAKHRLIALEHMK